MSYDIELVDQNGDVIVFDEPHGLTGGTYALGDQRARLNVTYNYSRFFVDLFGEDGIRALYGKKAGETIPLLEDAIARLEGEPSDNYWDACPGNARRALEDLLVLARLAPEGIWRGD